MLIGQPSIEAPARWRPIEPGQGFAPKGEVDEVCLASQVRSAVGLHYGGEGATGSQTKRRREDTTYPPPHVAPRYQSSCLGRVIATQR